MAIPSVEASKQAKPAAFCRAPISELFCGCAHLKHSCATFQMRLCAKKPDFALQNQAFLVLAES